MKRIMTVIGTDPGSRRRAKIKLLAKKSIETGEDYDAIPESYRQYLALQAMDSGKPLNRNFLARNGPMAGYGTNLFLSNDHASPQKVGKYI